MNLVTSRAKCVSLAIKHGVRIGAHPSYPDLQGFGRRVMDMTFKQLHNAVLYQVSAVRGVVLALGGQLKHVKPHGALYNYSATDEQTCEAIYSATNKIDPNLKIVGLPSTAHEEVASRLGLPFLREGFGDRRYNAQGLLVSRKEAGSVLNVPQEVSAQIINMVIDKSVTAMSDARNVALEVDTICIHGDNPGSVEILRHLHQELPNHGIKIGRS